jgi:hypothetical protein
MVAHHIHDALSQVRRMQEIILERRSFRGYSGGARMVGAVVTLSGAVVMGADKFPKSDFAHLLGWLAVLGIALLLNYGALGFWFLFNPRVKRNGAMLVPAVDALPALAMGALMTVGLVVRSEYDLLFGTWMILFGLANVTYRKSLPPSNYAVGTFYMICGAICFIWPEIELKKPLPMGLVFFVGEMVGGCVLYRNNLLREQEDKGTEE